MIDMLAELAELRNAVDKLEELCEWDKLKEMSGPSASLPFFHADEQFSAEIRDIYGWFCQLDQSLRQALNQPELVGSPEQLARWDRGMRELENRVRRLHLPERFINH